MRSFKVGRLQGMHLNAWPEHWIAAVLNCRSPSLLSRLIARALHPEADTARGTLYLHLSSTTKQVHDATAVLFRG